MPGLRVGQAAKVAPCQHEGLLGDVGGRLGVGADGQGDGVDGLGAAFDEALESLGVAVLGGADVL